MTVTVTLSEEVADAVASVLGTVLAADRFEYLNVADAGREDAITQLSRRSTITIAPVTDAWAWEVQCSMHGTVTVRQSPKQALTSARGHASRIHTGRTDITYA